MAKVEIPDELFAALQAYSRQRFRSEDPSELFEQIARRYLRDNGVPGFDRDALSGSLLRPSLLARIDAATFGSSWTDRSLYHERFLCIDLDNFKKYIDVRGLTAGDAALRELAVALKKAYGPDDVFRYGGDEYVVVLGDREVVLPGLIDKDASLKHAIVDVSTHRDQFRNRHINSWIDLHLQTGVLAARPEGNRIECGDPIWLQHP